MTHPLLHVDEPASNQSRETLAAYEPISLRTYTPTQAVLQKSAGAFHWTPEGRQLYDFTSGVLVANLGHNPRVWMERFLSLLGWDTLEGDEYISAVPMTAYNAVTEVEMNATRKLVEALQSRPGGGRLERVMWAASGSEAIQKALWGALARDRDRQMIIATRYGFHGKKGLAGAATGSETDSERDPRVKFISFPMVECHDLSLRDADFDPLPYRKELDALWTQFGRRLSVLITEPYLGGGGSYHPPKSYLQMLQQFCREKDLTFILDEVQSNFGRTGDLFAYETYGLEPDVVVLGKGLGNGIPVAAAVGSEAVFEKLNFGEGSDTWSANPICCSAVLATLEAFESSDILAHSRQASALIEEGLIGLKKLPFVSHVRGEKGGMVWGVEACDYGDHSAEEWANAVVLSCYRGESEKGIHLLGPLAKKVIRIAPPLTMTLEEASDSVQLLYRLAENALDLK